MLVAQTLWTVARHTPLSLGFPRQNYSSGGHSLLQQIFLTRASNPSLLHCRQLLYPLNHQGNFFHSYHLKKIIHNSVEKHFFSYAFLPATKHLFLLSRLFNRFLSSQLSWNNLQWNSTNKLHFLSLTYTDKKSKMEESLGFSFVSSNGKTFQWGARYVPRPYHWDLSLEKTKR